MIPTFVDTTWRRSRKGAALFTSLGAWHVSVFRRPHSDAMRVKLEAALPPHVSTEAQAQVWLLAHVVPLLPDVRDGAA